MKTILKYIADFLEDKVADGSFSPYGIQIRCETLPFRKLSWRRLIVNNSLHLSKLYCYDEDSTRSYVIYDPLLDSIPLRYRNELFDIFSKVLGRERWPLNMELPGLDPRPLDLAICIEAAALFQLLVYGYLDKNGRILIDILRHLPEFNSLVLTWMDWTHGTVIFPLRKYIDTMLTAKLKSDSALTSKQKQEALIRLPYLNDPAIARDFPNCHPNLRLFIDHIERSYGRIQVWT